MKDLPGFFKNDPNCPHKYGQLDKSNPPPKLDENNSQPQPDQCNGKNPIESDSDESQLK